LRARKVVAGVDNAGKKKGERHFFKEEEPIGPFGNKKQNKDRSDPVDGWKSRKKNKNRRRGGKGRGFFPKGKGQKKL